MNDIIKHFPNDFPMHLINKGYSLVPIGVSEMVWKFTDAIEIINFLANQGYPILGGDVYLEKDNVFESTYDSWYLEKSESKNFAEESRKKALDYIYEYAKNNGDQYFFSIVFETA